MKNLCNLCKLTAGIKKCKSTIKKKRKKHDNIALLAKTRLNLIEVLISKALIDLIDSYYTHDGFASVHNVQWEIKNPKNAA